MNGKDAGHLKSMFRALDRTHRLILLLFYVDQLTPVEIGCVLDMPETEVHKSLRALRAKARATVGSFAAMS